MMKFRTVALAAGLAAGLTGTAASAQDAYRPLTVNPHRRAVPAYAPPAYDPSHKPATIVTGPVHFAGAIAELPFRAVNSVFPPRGNTPLVLVGAPVYLAGQLVQLPFRIAEAPFGGPDPFAY